MADKRINDLENKPTVVDGDLVAIYDSATGIDKNANVQSIADLVSIPVTSVNGSTGVVVLDSDDIAEGITNLYDKTVALTEGTGIEVTGSYPNFTITNTATAGIAVDFPIGFEAIISNNITTPNDIIDISAGKCYSQDGTTYLEKAAGSLNITTAGSYADGILPQVLTSISPTMTGASAPAGYNVTTDKQQSGNEAWRCWDNNINTRWSTYSAGPPAYNGIEIPVAKISRNLILTAANDGNYTGAPTSFTLVGSNTGAFAGEETTLLTRPSESAWSQAEVRAYPYSNAVGFKYHRLNILTCAGPYAGLASIEIQSYELDLSNASKEIWLDNNSGTPRYILDDDAGTNLTDANKARKISPLYTDGSGNLHTIDVKGSGRTLDYLFGSLFAYTTTGVKTLQVPPNSLLKGYTTGSVKDLVDNITYPAGSFTDLIQTDASSQIENISGNTYVKGFRLER